MSSTISENLQYLKKQIPEDVCLVAVSKTKPIEDLEQAYEAGQRVFGENKIQEMTGKWEYLPKDIEWHMIGSVQRNKVKYMAPYVHLIHAVDSLRLLEEINKQALKNKRKINCLLQLKIATEETKQGLDIDVLFDIINSDVWQNFTNIEVKGLMGMASFTADQAQIEQEFTFLRTTFDRLKAQSLPGNINMEILSMGMSGDYPLAIAAGSTMIRVGSAIFGKRNYN